MNTKICKITITSSMSLFNFIKNYVHKITILQNIDNVHCTYYYNVIIAYMNCFNKTQWYHQLLETLNMF